MKWKKGRRSSNIEDRRGMRVSQRLPRGGLGGGMRGGMGLVGVIVVVVIALALGVDPAALLQDMSGGGSPGVITQEGPPPAEQEELHDFVAVVLADTEDTWAVSFKQANLTYQEPVLVLFTGAVESACGYADAAIGPFYCPGDQKVYLDLGFFDELSRRFGAPGDFAQAYVIAHEVGHHIQNLFCIEEQVRQLQHDASQRDANALSVKMELQADCLAGVWASSANKRGLLDVGDVDEALNAASAIGDDRLQQEANGYVAPDSFTHGTSAQRASWFNRGFARGDVEQCDTFSAEQL